MDDVNLNPADTAAAIGETAKPLQTAITAAKAGNYHEIFLPLLDVYDEGGELVFKEFTRKEEDGGKNLVVVPKYYFKKLGEMVKKDSSYGSAAALKFLTEIKGFKGKPLSGAVIYHASDGLDICVLKDEKFRKEFSESQLEKAIVSRFNSEKERLTFVTSDDSSHMLLDIDGLKVEEPKFLIADEGIIFKGIVEGNDDLYAALYSSRGKLPAQEAVEFLAEGTELFVNRFVRFVDSHGNSKYAVVEGNLKKNHDGSRIKAISGLEVRLLDEKEYSKKLHIGDKRKEHFITEDILGIYPKDIEQYLALQYILLNPDVSTGFLCGKAGSGKTILSYVYAIDSILEYDAKLRQLRGGLSRKPFDSVVIMKAPEILGGKRREIGFLPGDKLMKIKDHLMPYKDAHDMSVLKDIRFEEMFFHPRHENDVGGPRNPKIAAIPHVQAYLPSSHEAIEFLYSGHAGGRSKANTLIIVDETQDFTPYEVKTMIERVGLDSKIIFLGDPKQVRNPFCTPKKNGLTFGIKHFLGEPYVALIALARNYRHQMSEHAESMRVYKI